MGMGHENFSEELMTYASHYRFSEISHRNFYRRWGQLMDDGPVG